MIDLEELDRMLDAGDRFGHATSPAVVRDLIAEVTRLRTANKLQANAARMGMDAAKSASTIQLQLAEQVRAESLPAVLESERQVNSILTEENERLTSERDGAIEMANKNALDASRWQHIYHGPYVVCRVHADGRLENLGGSYVGKYAIDDGMAARAVPTADAVTPMQPLILDRRGTARFKENAIVRHLLDKGGIDLNALAMLDFSDGDRAQFAQLIGYSVSGYGELDYVSDESYERAAAGVDTAIAAVAPRETS